MIATLIAVALIGPLHSSPTKPVTPIAEEEFDSFLEENDIVLVNFHDDGEEAGQLEPYFQQAAAQAKEEGLAAVFASVDITNADDLSAQHALVLERKPLVRLFRYGRMDEAHYDNFNPWNDTATPDNLLAFARTKSVFPLDVVDSKEDLELFKLEDKITLMAFVEDFEGPITKTLIHDVAAVINTESTTLPIAISTNRQLAEAHGISVPSVVLFSRWPKTEYMPSQRVLDAKLVKNGKALRTWTIKYMMPHVIHFDQPNSTTMFATPIKKHFLVIASR
jgi:hypothetical protein